MAELTIDPELKGQRFGHERTVNGVQQFTFSHLPHIGVLCMDPHALIIPAVATAGFSPNSMGDLKMVKEGDLITMVSDTKHDVFKMWTPPAEYQVPNGYSDVFKVALVVRDATDCPLIICRPSL